MLIQVQSVPTNEKGEAKKNKGCLVAFLVKTIDLTYTRVAF